MMMLTLIGRATQRSVREIDLGIVTWSPAELTDPGGSQRRPRLLCRGDPLIE
jgi:hypothetical protein